MLTQSRLTRARLLQAADGALFALALLAAYLLRSSLLIFDRPQIETFGSHLWLFPVVALIGPIALASQGFYRHAQFASRLNLIWTVIRGTVIAILVLIFLLFLVRVQYARSVVLLACGFGGLAAYFRHEVSFRLSATPLSQSQWRQRVLWVGVGEENTRLRDALTWEERTQIESISEFDPRHEPLEQLEAILHDFSINAVIINLAGLDSSHVAPVLAACEREGVSIVVRPGLLARSPLGMRIDWFGGEPVILYQAHAARPTDLFLKQVVDHVGGAVLLLLSSPLLLLIAVLIKATSPGPVFYRQVRAGLNGRPFTMLKFRSMRVGADREKASLAPLNEMTGPVFKITHDPRVTPIGRILRRHGLDELPQLINVVRGEMSLVGPRPLPVEEVKRFSDDAHRRRLSVRPGLTCLWQIGGRNDISDFGEWVRLDLAYIDRWSLWLDCKILIATIPAVLFGRGGR